jgi:peptidoglycan hydrolase-like protein with peptidoglycan-binding domain
MFSKIITATTVVLSLSLMPFERAHADKAGAFAAGALIGGLVGHAITKENQRKKAAANDRRKKSTTQRSSIPATATGREIQTSLNFFKFKAGKVDGQLGNQSRKAVKKYQRYLGYSPTGQLTPFEQNFLISSYYRAQASGYQPRSKGVKKLLKQYRQEMAGATTAPAASVTVAAAPSPAAVEPEVTTTASLPNFLDNGAGPSLTAHCNMISLVTNTNGGFKTAATMTDPNVALNEQFCLARTYAISDSENLITKAQAVTSSQVVEQCKQFGPAMEQFVASLPIKSLASVTQDVVAFLPSTGMPLSQLQVTAQICLGVGYRIDDMSVALGSALLLYATGDRVYAELIGHHLAQGFGTTRQIDAARFWYADALNALESGSPAVFAPGQPDRTELLRKASMSLGINTGSIAPANTQPQAASLPAFGIVSE